jgi:hypothetical protein
VDPWFTPLAAAVLSFVTRNSEPALSNHSIRSFLFARLVAHERGLVVGRGYPLEALFCACTLHDIGLTEAGNRGQRSEVDGADLASELLASHGVATAQIDIVWQAIVLNSSPGIAERFGVVCDLTLAGVVVDFTGAPFISDTTASRIHEAYPRLKIGSALSDAIVTQARDKPQKAPLFSMSAQVVEQRSTAPHITELERIARTGRWGE